MTQEYDNYRDPGDENDSQEGFLIRGEMVTLSPLAEDWPASASLGYKDDVSLRVIEAVEDYLEFGTMRDLLELLAMNL